MAAECIRGMVYPKFSNLPGSCPTSKSGFYAAVWPGLMFLENCTPTRANSRKVGSHGAQLKASTVKRCTVSKKKRSNFPYRMEGVDPTINGLYIGVL